MSSATQRLAVALECETGGISSDFTLEKHMLITDILQCMQSLLLITVSNDSTRSALLRMDVACGDSSSGRLRRVSGLDRSLVGQNIGLRGSRHE